MKKQLVLTWSRILPAALAVVLVAMDLRAADAPVRTAPSAPDPVRAPVTAADPVRASSAPAAPGETFRQAISAADLRLRTDWYGMYFQTTKVGWAKDEFMKNGEVYVDTLTLSMELSARGQSLRAEMSERREFDGTPPFTLRSVRVEQKENGVPSQSVRLTRTKDGFVVSVTQDGQTHSPPVPALDYTLGDLLGEELWFRKPRAVGDTVRVRSLNVEDLQMDVNVTTVTSRKETIVQGVPTVFYEAIQKSEKQGHELLVRVEGDGKLLSMFVGPFEARMEPEDVAKKTEKSGDLFVFGMAKLDQPIGPAVKVERLVLAVEGAGAKALENTARQTVVRDEASGAVTLQMGAEFGKAGPVAQTEIDTALAETIDLPTKSPEVVALAKQAVGEATAAREKTDRLVHFVSRYVKNESVTKTGSVREIIAKKRGDCTEHALLFEALARASGLPARRVGGLMYLGDDVQAFGGHEWNEVVIDGQWVPVDATWDETVLDAAHITLDREGEKSNFLATVGALQFKLKDVKKQP